MEIVFDEVDRLEFFIADLNPFGVAVVVHVTSDLKAGFGGRRGDQIDNHLVTDQRLTSPILADE